MIVTDSGHFAAQGSGLGRAGNDESATGRRWAGTREVRRSVGAAHRWAQSARRSVMGRGDALRAHWDLHRRHDASDGDDFRRAGDEHGGVHGDVHCVHLQRGGVGLPQSDAGFQGAVSAAWSIDTASTAYNAVAYVRAWQTVCGRTTSTSPPPTGRWSQHPAHCIPAARSALT